MRAQFVRLQLVKHAMSEKWPLPVIEEKIEGLVQYILNGTDEYTKQADKIDQKYAEALLRRLQQRFGETSIYSIEVVKNTFILNVSDASKEIIEWEVKGPNAPDWIVGREVKLIVVIPPKKP